MRRTGRRDGTDKSKMYTMTPSDQTSRGFANKGAPNRATSGAMNPGNTSTQTPASFTTRLARSGDAPPPSSPPVRAAALHKARLL